MRKIVNRGMNKILKPLSHLTIEYSLLSAHFSYSRISEFFTHGQRGDNIQTVNRNRQP